MTIDVLGDGASQAVQLPAGPLITGISVAASTWGSGTSLVLQYSPDGTVWGPLREDGIEVTITSDWSGGVEGEGYVRVFATSFSGTSGLKVAVGG